MTPEDLEQAEVARLLAAASKDAQPSLPPEVSRSLDDVLAALVAERAAPSATSTRGSSSEHLTNSKLAAARRRRVGQVLVAAAAVTVLAVGIGNVMTQTTGSGGASNSATSEEALDQKRLTPGRKEDARASNGQDESTALSKDRGALRLRSDSLNADVQRIAESPLADRSPKSAVADQRCTSPATKSGDDKVSVRLDGRPATLVLRAPVNGLRLAQVYPCQEPDAPVGSTTVNPRLPGR